eukprot:TRINITY_DN5773_c0_g1_i4.p1 TRINITY_DN5773_c0_g1~~TRINITY_DN5773_c0_g1_i4.p1  ORF type:complete len:378 (+),score=40.53 TRINITY_DN5773_c0_g1_i4:413-1546(+)
MAPDSNSTACSERFRLLHVSYMYLNENHSHCILCSVVETDDVLDYKIDNLTQDLQALFINVKWKLEDSDYQEGVLPEEMKEKLKISRKLMKNGIVFIWSEKEYLADIMRIFNDRGFAYIENFSIVFLSMQTIMNYSGKGKSFTDTDPPASKTKKLENEKAGAKKNSKITSFFTKASTPPVLRTSTRIKKTVGRSTQAVAEDSENSPSISKTTDTSESVDATGDDAQVERFLKERKYNLEIDGSQAFLTAPADYFRKTKKVLLMFRRNEGGKEHVLELRHQRTSDVVFDLVKGDTDNDMVVSQRCKEYVYKMIETLLPKALWCKENQRNFKMMELFGEASKPREGWISICESGKYQLKGKTSIVPILQSLQNLSLIHI